MSRSGEKSEEQKVPLGAKLGLGLLNIVGKASGRTGKNKQGKKGSTVISFGFGDPLVTREAYPEERKFTFQILSAAETDSRGVAVFGTVAQGEVHTGDTVTCVTKDGRRFSCVIREIEQAFANASPTDTARAGETAASPPFYTLFVSDHSPEDFHPHGKFIIETGEYDEQCL